MNRARIAKDYLLIIIGTGIMALSIQSIFDPLGMVTGGFSGIAIIVKYLTENLMSGGFPLWLTNILLNIPLFFIAIKMKGFNFVKRTLVGAVSLSVWLYLLPVIAPVNDDLILAGLFGGVIQGVGIGMAFMGRGTTGGSDLVASLLQVRFRQYSVSQILQIVDGVIVLLGALVFGAAQMPYAIIAIYVISKVSDGIIEGVKFCKAAFIITNDYQNMSQELMKALSRGVTGISIRGMFSGKENKMLFCVVSKKQIVPLKELVNRLDPTAFVIVTDAREVMGEGFIDPFKLEK